MPVIKQIGNHIDPSIQLEVDYPSLHTDNKLPLLDIKMWSTKIQNEENEDVNIILHEYYYKEVASKTVINTRSSMPLSDKRTILTQEVLRILLRCSPHLAWDITAKHVSEYMLRMQYSGYHQNFREQITRSALKAYEIIKMKEEKGEQPMYRTKEWKLAERLKQKLDKKTSWFKRGGADTVIFIPATPNSVLKHKYEEEIKRTQLRIKIIETPGPKIVQKVQKSHPFPPRPCMTMSA